MTSKILIILIVIVIVIALYLLLNINSPRVLPNINSSRILPKKIWTYWNDTNLPYFVKLCIDSWKKHNPSWEIIILNDNNIRDYIPELDFNKIKFIDMPQRKSDVIRVNILSKYGGVWSDASNLFKSNLDWITYQIETQNKDLVGFYIDSFTSNKNFPVIENWFFACLPNTKFINLWKNTFMKINDYNNVEEYIEYMRKNTDFQKINSPHYLAMHIAAQHVMQNNFTVKELQNNIYLLKAEDGPFKYLTNNNWDSTKGILSICNGDSSSDTIIKFRGCERESIEKNKELHCVFNKFNKK